LSLRYTMANLTFEYDFLAVRAIRPQLVLIRVYPCESVADFSLCINFQSRDFDRRN